MSSIIQKLICLPDVKVAPLPFLLPLYFVSYFSGFVTVVLMSGKLFYGSLKCLDNTPGIDEYCANQNLYVITDLERYLYHELNVGWVLSLSSISLWMCIIALVLINVWRLTAEPVLVEYHSLLSTIVKDPETLSNDLSSAKVALWKYRQQNTFPLARYSCVSVVALLFMLTTWVSLCSRSDFLKELDYNNFEQFTYVKYIPREIMCQRNYYGPSGSIQHLDYTCTVIRADFINMVLYSYFLLGFVSTIMILLNLLGLLILLMPVTPVFLYMLAFSLNYTTSVKLYTKFTRKEIFFFYLLKLNLSPPLFSEIFKEYFYL